MAGAIKVAAAGNSMQYNYVKRPSMNLRKAQMRALGALGVLALAAGPLASGCGDSQSNTQSGGTGGSGGSGGSTVAGTGGTGGSVAGTGGSGGTSGVGTGGTAGTPISAGGATSGSSGTGGGLGGAGTGGVPPAGMGGDAGSVATGGTPPVAGQGGSTAGSAGSAGSGAGSGGEAGWWFSGPRTPPPIGTWPPPNIKLTEVVGTGLEQPTAIAAPRADPTRLYVTEKWGIIRLIKDGVLQTTPALDIRTAVLEGGPQAGNELLHQGKRGLVGLAFHPEYETNGRIFVLYVADQGTVGVYGTAQNQWDDGDMTIAEYKRSTSNPDIFDPTPVAEIVQWDKGNCDQCNQHNGGSLEVDVDGFLWASSGDPPPYTDAGSQDLNNLNGKLLRFDISGATVVGAGNYPGADPYVASIGIRNTYKFSFDRYTGDMYVGDVGEADREEVTVERYGQNNQNHGWPIREGTLEFQPPYTCATCIEPVFDYQHLGAEGSGADNCIIGGYVYRGEAIPGLQGAYIYGDNGSGAIRAIQVQNGALTSQGAHTFPLADVFMGCFGEDAAGEIYVCDYNNRKILRVDAQ